MPARRAGVKTRHVKEAYVALGETGSFYGIYKYEGHIGKVDVAISKSPALADADATPADQLAAGNHARGGGNEHQHQRCRNR